MATPLMCYAFVFEPVVKWNGYPTPAFGQNKILPIPVMRLPYTVMCHKVALSGKTITKNVATYKALLNLTVLYSNMQRYGKYCCKRHITY